MNSNKSYDRFNFAKYFLFVDFAIIAVAIAIMCIFGFNISSTQSEHIVLQSVLSVVISLVLITIYLTIRYDFAKAFTVVVISVHNVLLSTALICLIRIPVSETITMGYILLVGLTSIFSLILFDKIKTDDKKLDKNLAIKNALAENIKLISIFVAIVVAVMLLCMIFSNSSIFDFARELFAMMLVLIYSIIVLILPVYIYFARRIKKKSRAKVDTTVENQKVYQATQQDVQEENTNESV